MARLARVNPMLAGDESEWLNQLVRELHAFSVANVSRSEIVREGIAVLRELHKLAPEAPHLIPLTARRAG